MTDEIEQIRARHKARIAWKGGINSEVSEDIATLLAHIDTLNRAIAAHKRDEEQRAETEQAAFENGRKAALAELRAVLTPEVLDKAEYGCRYLSDMTTTNLRRAKELLHD